MEDNINIHKRGITINQDNLLMSFHNKDKEGQMWVVIDRDEIQTSLWHLTEKEAIAIRDHLNKEYSI